MLTVQKGGDDDAIPTSNRLIDITFSDVLNRVINRNNNMLGGARKKNMSSDKKNRCSPMISSISKDH